MSLRQKYLRILAGLVPAGTVGISVLLGSAAPAGANQEPATEQLAAAGGVAERLAAIRHAVSEVGGAGQPRAGEQQLAWSNLWHNGGRWRNGGFRPFWGNGYGIWQPWNNWRNGWNNWRNG